LLESVRQLDREVAAEQAFAQQANMGGLSYGGFAAGIIVRRERLAASMAEIRQQMDVKTEEISEVFRELKRYEIARDQREKREQIEADRRAQAALDEVSLIQHQRKLGS
jgi:flagellar export protein FliJ